MKFKPRIFGVSTAVQMDYNLLVNLFETAPKNSNFMRWLLTVHEFNNAR